MKNLKRKDYLDRLEQLLDILKENETQSITDIATIFNVNNRTVYRMIYSLEQQGYMVDSGRGYPRLIARHSELDDDITTFTQQEQATLQEVIMTLMQNDPCMKGLEGPLGDKLRSVVMPYFMCNKHQLRCVSKINEGMQNHKQVVLCGYRSSHSGTISNRTVEPVQWSPNYRQVYAFDTDRHEMRCFVINRIASVNVTPKSWQFGKQHVKMECDCFWMTGTPIEVDLHLDMLALNLLHEEYPLSTNYKIYENPTPNCELPYRVRMTVRSLLGVNRFVKGLELHAKLIELPRTALTSHPNVPTE
ncbi:MAG: HTH domain-containing protein [Bacteroidales bacterium]|nr:HTH domain-containing protein [Candidatus Colimorpha onthohippi]